uniref:Uncharacterized protein n=1 Tax=Trichuris muris TaxID=70415 RepID=A0A5S6Q7S2_TRIMR
MLPLPAKSESPQWYSQIVVTLSSRMGFNGTYLHYSLSDCFLQPLRAAKQCSSNKRQGAVLSGGTVFYS